MIPGLTDRYQIVSTLGSGGTSVVYKATDTSLKRPVAIKALGPHLYDRTGRHLRAEALAAASLDHPYICKVYELIETADQTLIVMEFVEGETLAAKLQRGLPPLEATLVMGSEIAEGLAAAHARGLVHRDIKPSNVMVTPHGHVKILDFGLASARTVAGPPARGRAARSGSPAYMSPEQARGKDVTPQSDLFSLGVVLYECLSGRLPFEGRTPFEYVANLVTEKAAPLGPRAPHAPFAVVQLVERCLDKDPQWRPESAAALARELQRLLEAGARGAAAQSVIRWSSPRFRWGTAAAAALAAVAALTFAFRASIWPGPDALDAPREVLPLVTWPSDEGGSMLSPDGKWISFISNRDGTARVWLRPVAGGDASPLALDGEPVAHVWSPDGSRIAVYVFRGGALDIAIVPAFFGGAVEKRVPVGAPPETHARLLRWVGDDIYLASSGLSIREGQLLTRVNLLSGTREDVTPKIDPQIEWLDVNADGTLVVLSGVTDEREDLWIADLGGTRVRRLTDDAAIDRYPLWTGGTVTFQSNRGGQIDLWQIDPATLRTRLLTSSEAEERPEGATHDGSLMTYQVARETSRLWRLGASGRPVPLVNDSLGDYAPAVSPDGRTVVFQRQAASPTLGATLLDSQIFVARTNAAGAEVAAPTVTAGFFPVLSPGGGELAYFERPSSGSRFVSLFVKHLGTSSVRAVSTQVGLPGFSPYPIEWVHQSLAWSSDGSLFFIEQGAEGSLVRRFDPRDGTTKNVTGVLRSYVMELHPSPDGTRLAYLLFHDRTFQVRERDLASGDERVLYVWPARTMADYQLRGWAADGSLIAIKREAPPNGDRPSMEVLKVTPGSAQSLVRVNDAYAVTARIAPTGAALLFTAGENDIYNIYALPLDGGALRRVTDNELLGKMFSGIRALDNGSLIYAVNERRKDIWLSRPAREGTRR